MHILTEGEIKIVGKWEGELPYKFELYNTDNADTVIGTAWSKFGKITPETLDAAVAITCRSLKYIPGFEHPVIKAEIEKQKADADALEATRKREAKVRAGLNVDQRKVRTEFDRDEGSQERARNLKEASEKKATDALENAAKAEVEKVCSQYIVSSNGERMDHSRTAERRQLLKDTKAFKNGKVSWTETLKLLNKCLRGFEREDSKRGG